MFRIGIPSSISQISMSISLFVLTSIVAKFGTEAIAAYGGLDEKSKGYNIRIIRGDLKNPEVTVVNLRTINDMKNSIVNLQPDDIIYIEPIRRPGSEVVRDNIYIFNFLQIITTLSLLINNFTK